VIKGISFSYQEQKRHLGFSKVIYCVAGVVEYPSICGNSDIVDGNSAVTTKFANTGKGSG